MSAVKSAIASRHAANVAEVIRLSGLLKEARAAVIVSGNALARERAVEEKKVLKETVDKSKVVCAKAKDKVIKGSVKQTNKGLPAKGSKLVCRPFVAVAAAESSRRERDDRQGPCRICALRGFSLLPL